jgi:Aldo/keto reductase family
MEGRHAHRRQRREPRGQDAGSRPGGRRWSGLEQPKTQAGARPETSEAILAEYLDRGGNVVDTANIYTNGHSEKIIVALAWVRSRPAITSTLIGARTIEQLRSNLASLELALTPEQLAALDEPSAPSLDFPAPNNARLGPLLGFGGTTVDGVQLPVWPALLQSSARY